MELNLKKKHYYGVHRLFTICKPTYEKSLLSSHTSYILFQGFPRYVIYKLIKFRHTGLNKAKQVSLLQNPSKHLICQCALSSSQNFPWNTSMNQSLKTLPLPEHATLFDLPSSAHHERIFFLYSLCLSRPDSHTPLNTLGSDFGSICSSLNITVSHFPSLCASPIPFFTSLGLACLFLHYSFEN